MDGPADLEASRDAINERMAALFSEAAGVKQKLLAITETAAAENWDMNRYRVTRSELQGRLDEIGLETKRLFGVLESQGDDTTG